MKRWSTPLGKFTLEAETYVATIDAKVILIDGRELAELMIDYNLASR
ncbi:MAG: hypothetical protein ACE5JX_08600 [Acidobacteriota bacterium]